MRKLVTIRKVDKLLDIPKKDRIEIAVIGGWSCIVKKGEFQVNDLGVFFEIDSFIPEHKAFSFLGKSTTHQKKQGYRIKTMKLAGAISQGLLLPFSFFKDNFNLDLTSYKEDENITELLDVIKYDIDLSRGNNGAMVTGQSKGQFPSFIPKTDQKRIENLSFYFDMYKDHEFEETLKLDGSSCTMYKIEKKQTLLDIIKDKVLNFLFDTDFSNEHFGVCSRNLELREPDPEEKSSNFWDCAYKYKIKKSLPVGYSIQGEVLATNIQGNYEKVKETEYYIFNVYDINKREYLKPLHARTFVSKYLPEANYIPVINESIKIFSNENCSSIEELRNRIDSKSIYGAVSEGRVYKSTTDSKITFKAINPKYLLQKGK